MAWLSFAELDFSWARIVEGSDPQKLSLMLPLDDPNLPWLGTLVGVPILGFYFWCTNQFIVQRALFGPLQLPRNRKVRPAPGR